MPQPLVPYRPRRYGAAHATGHLVRHAWHHRRRYATAFRTAARKAHAAYHRYGKGRDPSKSSRVVHPTRSIKLRGRGFFPPQKWTTMYGRWRGTQQLAAGDSISVNASLMTKYIETNKPGSYRNQEDVIPIQNFNVLPPVYGRYYVSSVECTFLISALNNAAFSSPNAGVGYFLAGNGSNSDANNPGPEGLMNQILKGEVSQRPGLQTVTLPGENVGKVYKFVKKIRVRDVSRIDQRYNVMERHSYGLGTTGNSDVDARLVFGSAMTNDVLYDVTVWVKFRVLFYNKILTPLTVPTEEPASPSLFHNEEHHLPFA